MKKKLKYIIIACAGIISFTTLILYSFGYLAFIPGSGMGNSDDDDDDYKDDEVNDPLSYVENITLIVDYNDGKIDRWDDFNLSDETTAFDATMKWCDVDYTDYGWGIFVKAINNVENKYPNYWFYGVNGEIAPVGCSAYNLQHGDTVNWVYDEEYSPP